MEGVWLFNFPVPPSDNQLYRNVPRIGRVKTKEYKDWKKELEIWEWQNQKHLVGLREYCLLKPLLNIHILLKMRPERFFTQKKTVKKIDAHNRLKATCDGLAEIIGLDDSHFWCVSIQKVIHASDCLDLFIQTHSLTAEENS